VSVYIKREGRLMESEQVIKFRDRIADLEAENAALWAFVKEMRTLQVVLSDTKKPNETWKQRHTRKFHQAEELIYQYEDEP
jgi:hypothetical protein